MIRPAALLLTGLVAIELPFGLQPPAWVERTLYNARERTEAGRAAYEGERYADAVAELERARRIAAVEGEAPSPDLDFNAGTAHLAAGDAQAALPLLDAAARATAATTGEPAAAASDGPAATGRLGELAVASRYNLGNARLAGDDPAGAVEAFKSALRLAPGHADAKYNLELALRHLAERRKPQLKPPQEAPGGDRQGEQERSPQGGGAEPSQERDDRGDPGDQNPSPKPQGGSGDEPPEEPQQAAPPRPLPQFQDQPDMTAEQAAALLEAVENLEREQRRADAVQRARQKAAGRKDW